MARKVAKDVFMNWYGLEVTADAADSTVLASKDFNTGSGIATNVAWRVHMIESIPDMSISAALRLKVALSTRKGLSAFPDINDKGVIAMFDFQAIYATSGAAFLMLPTVASYLPPMIIASPNISMYCITNTNMASQRGVTHIARMGFTAVDLDSEAYRELYGTWNYAD